MVKGSGRIQEPGRVQDPGRGQKAGSGRGQLGWYLGGVMSLGGNKPRRGRSMGE